MASKFAVGRADLERVLRMLPGAQSWNPLSTQAQYVSALHASRRTFRKFGLDNPLRLAHFIGQGLIETGFLQHKSENLGYTVDGLLKVFPKHFSDRNDALRYERQPQLIANRVYGSRMGNGDESSGDGWRYRGRGFFQLTGKENYGRFGELAGVDLVRDPDILIRDLRKSILVAAAYFSRTGLIEHADRDNASAVSRGVNLGNPKSFRQAHREADRVLWTRKVYASLRDRSDEALPHDVSRGEGGLDVGAVSQRVRDLQHKLNMLGYRAGAEDGVFAQATRRAVVLFQEEYGLRATGVVDAKTAALIEEALEDLRHAPAIVPASSAGATPAAAANRKAGSAGAVAAGIGVAAATNGNNAVQEIDAVGIVPRLKPANIPAESMAPAQSAPGEGITVSTAEAFPESVLKAVNADMLVAGALIAAIILGVLVFRGSRRRAPDPLAPIQRRFRPFRYLTVALWIVASAAVNLLGLSSLAAEFGWIPAPDWKPPLDEVQEVYTETVQTVFSAASQFASESFQLTLPEWSAHAVLMYLATAFAIAATRGGGVNDADKRGHGAALWPVSAASFLLRGLQVNSVSRFVRDHNLASAAYLMLVAGGFVGLQDGEPTVVDVASVDAATAEGERLFAADELSESCAELEPACDAVVLSKAQD